MIRILIRVLYQSLLSTIDLVFILHMVMNLSATPSVLGLIGLLWSIIFIIFSLIAVHLGDNGHVYILSILSSAALMISIYILAYNSQTLLYATLGYMFHAVSTAFGRISHIVSLNESYHFEDWDRILILSQSLQRFIYSFYLIILLYLGLNMFINTALLYLSITLLLIYPLMHEYRGFERIFGKTITHLNDLGLLSRYMIMSTDVDTWSEYETLSDWMRERGSVKSILVSLLLTGIAMEIIMFPIPAYLINIIGRQNLILIYIFNSITTGVFILTFYGRIGLSTSGFLRVLILLLLIYVLMSPASIYNIMLLIIGFALLNIFNTNFTTRLFNIYNNRSYGYGSGFFSIISEFGSVIGDLSLWYFLGGLEYVYVIITGLVLILISNLIIR